MSEGGWELLPFALAPPLLLAWLVLRWSRARTRLAPDPAVRLALLGGTALAGMLLAAGLSRSQRFDQDSERDWEQALRLAGGEAFPWEGPAIHSGPWRLGPTYVLAAGAAAAVSPQPQSFFALQVLAFLGTLWLGTLFLRRAAGRVAACTFALLWPGSLIPLVGIGGIGHAWLASPLLVLAAWAGWDAAAGRVRSALPVAALALGLAAQFYAPHGLLVGTALIALLAVQRVRPGGRDLAAAAGLALLPQLFTLLAALRQWADGLSLATSFAEDPGSRAGWFTRFVAAAFVGVEPLPGLLVAAAAVPALVLFAGRALRPPAADLERTAGRRSLWLLALVPLVVVTLARHRLEPHNLVVLLPFAPLLTAAALGEALERVADRLPAVRPTLAVGLASLVLLVLGGERVGAMPRGDGRGAVDLRDQQALVAGLRRLGVVDLDSLACRVHGPILHDKHLGLRVLLGLDDTPPAPEARAGQAVWVGRGEPVLPGADAVLRLGVRAPWTAAAFEPRLDPRRARVRRGPLAVSVPGHVFTLPWRPARAAHPQTWERRSPDRSAVCTRPPEADPGLGAAVEVEWPVDAELTRPLELVVSRGCRVELRADGRALAGRWRTEPPVEPAVDVAVYPPAGRVETLRLRVETAGCRLEDLDLYERLEAPPAAGAARPVGGDRR